MKGRRRSEDEGRGAKGARAFNGDERGATQIEYAAIVGVVALVGAGAFAAFTPKVPKALQAEGEKTAALDGNDADRNGATVEEALVEGFWFAANQCIGGDCRKPKFASKRKAETSGRSRERGDGPEQGTRPSPGNPSTPNGPGPGTTSGNGTPRGPDDGTSTPVATTGTPPPKDGTPRGPAPACTGGSCGRPGDDGKPGCFVASTPVATLEGLRPIASIRVGDRVQTRDDDAAGTAVDIDTWRDVVLEARDGRDAVTLELLRPPVWMDVVGARVGGTVHLPPSDLYPATDARVLAVHPAPTLRGARGRVVTGTFTRIAEDLAELRVESEPEPIRGTLGHPFFSLRRGWVPLGDLVPGEALRTAKGTTTVGSLRSAAEPARVYNLEVEEDHEYFVSGREILVHNACETMDLWRPNTNAPYHQRPPWAGPVRIDDNVPGNMPGQPLAPGVNPRKVGGIVVPVQTTGRPSPPAPHAGHATGNALGTHKGHIFALENGGPDVPGNIVPQSGRWQASGGWRAMEREVKAMALEEMRWSQTVSPGTAAATAPPSTALYLNIAPSSQTAPGTNEPTHYDITITRVSPSQKPDGTWTYTLSQPRSTRYGTITPEGFVWRD